MNLYAMTSLLCGTFCLVLAIFSFISGRGKIYQLLGWYNIAVSLWGFGNFTVALANNSGSALVGWKLAHFGGFFISAIFYHLVSVLCQVRRPKIVVFGYLQGVLFNVINLGTDWMMNQHHMRKAFGFFYIDCTILSSIAFCAYLALISLSYIELTRYLNVATDNKKEQVRYVYFGFLFGFIGGTSILFSEFRLDVLYPLGNLGVFIYATIVTYAVLYHKIFDVQKIAYVAHRDKLATIGILATSINHEIRNPLYIIQGMAQSCLANFEEGIFQDNQKTIRKFTEVLRKTEEQAARAVDIMKRFAAFAKQDVRQEAQIEKVDLNNVLSDVLPLVNHELELDKIELVGNTSQSLLAIKADRRHLEEILFNLIVNACQAMKEKDMPGKIEINAEWQNGHVSILVKDNGPGIPSDKLNQIFEPFYTTKTEGTGLGLYITKQLVEKNHGKISVASKPSWGTEFSLRFPTVKDEISAFARGKKTRLYADKSLGSVT